MTFDPTKLPFRTKSGMSVSLITTDGRLPQPIIGYIEDDDEVSSWKNDGKFHRDGKPSCLDLVNTPEEREMWVNAYDDGVWAPHKYKIDADTWAEARTTDRKLVSRIARLHLRFTVGQMDE